MSQRRRWADWFRLVGAVIGFAPLGASPVRAQAPWTVTLFVDPFPSPYQSDWETNPNISTLTIINPTGADRDVRLAYQVVNSRGQLLASGQSDPLGIPPGAPTVFTSYLDIAGSSSRDRATQDQMERTGRVPEGSYQACVTMADRSGFVLGESCAEFTIIYPDPPALLAPSEGESIATPAPIFQWTPIQIPPAFQVRYVLQIAEQGANQTAEEALNATIVHYQAPDIEVTNLQYPLDGQPFKPGKRYVWRVLALDQNGFAPAANGGASEIRSFRFDDGTSVGATARTELTVTLSNDFDDGPAETDPEGMTSASVDIKELCALWDDPPAAVTISAASPIGLKRFAGQPGILYRDEAASRWWLATTNRSGRRQVLVGGDCGGGVTGGKTRVRWIASKDSTLQAKINGMLTGFPGDRAPAETKSAASSDSLVFGMVVLALGKETVEAPDDFPEGKAFLQQRTLDVAPGLNLYTVLGLRDWGLWSLFQSMGYQEKQIELTGFLGWDASWNIGGAIGDKAGGDVSTERKFLVVRGDLPKRKPVGRLAGLFQQSRLSIEISIGDSTGRGFSLQGRETGYSLDLVGKLIHTIQVNDELALVGSVGFDLAREAKTGFAKEMLGRWEWLRGKRRTASTYLAGKDWKRLGAKMEPSHYEEPEVGLDLVISYGFQGRISSLWRAAPGSPNVFVDGASLDTKIRFSEKKLTAALSGTLTVAGIDGAVKLGASHEWSWEQERDTVALKDTVATLETQLSEQVAAVKEMPDCDGLNRDQHAVCRAFKGWREARKRLSDIRNPDTSWRIRLSAGHMSVGQLLDILKGTGP